MTDADIQDPAPGPADPAGPPAPRRRRRWGRRVALSLLLLLVALAAAHFIWGVVERRRLDAQVAEYRRLGDPMTPQSLDSPPVPDADNAALDLLTAGRSINDDENLRRMWDRDFAPPLQDKEVADIRTFVDAHGDARARARAARRKAGADWQVRFTTPVIQVQLPMMNEQRRLAVLLETAALSEHHAGNDAEAVELLRDVLHMSRAIDRIPILISHLVASGASELASERAGQIAPDLRVGDGSAGSSPRPASSEQMRALIADLLDDAGLRKGLAEGFRGERITQLDTALALTDRTMKVEDLAPKRPDEEPSSPIVQALLAYGVRPLFLSDARLMIRHTTSAAKSAAESPDWPTARPGIPRFPPEVEEHRLWHMLAAVLMPDYERAVRVHHERLAGRRMSAVALAARWYALEHDGRLPDKLEDLVPKYLPAVPKDPMAAGGTPLRYVNESADPARPRVYSVGVNGADDGGAEPDPRVLRRQSEAVSDIVLHLRRQPRRDPEDARRFLGHPPPPEPEAAEPAAAPDAPAPDQP